MKYRTKLYLAFFATSFVAALLGDALIYVKMKENRILAIRERLISIASTTAVLLDPELVKRAVEGGPSSTAYQELVQKLRLSRDANRTGTLYVRFLYLVGLSPTDPKGLIFIADAEENPASAVRYGDVDTSDNGIHLREHINEYYSPQKFITDKWLTRLSGFAPIYDREGQYLATVGVDIPIGDVDLLLNIILFYGMAGLIVSLLLAGAGAHILSKKITKSLHVIHSSVKEIGSGNLLVETKLKSNDEFGELALALNSMAQGLRERERLKINFARYVSKHMLEKILKSDSPLKVEGERRKITILFSDIRQFTQLAETLPPEEVVALLNEYFEAMIDIIFSYQGTLDKFLGDGIMVEFGAPLDDAVQEIHAIQTAIAMQKKLSSLREKWAKEGKPQITMGIAIHTGQAIVGNIGSEKRMEYTAIGDTVNVAAKLEYSTKTLKQPILISEMTYLAVKDLFPCQDVGLVSLPGRKEQITAYAVPYS